MVPLCNFVRPTGNTCNCPALRCRNRCYSTTRRVASPDPAAPPLAPDTAGTRSIAKYPGSGLKKLFQSGTSLPEAAINHEISQEMLYKILNRYTRRVIRLGGQMRQREASAILAHRKERRNSQNL